ncbi:MAG: hypothetical protein JXR56_06030, partial [Candidatus Cloacimonetes bacterium]|nr:hypothetical protein [Candidatus Cloacimonadota bacterium]
MRKILLLACLLFTAFLFADGVLPNGTGTETDPYLIGSYDNLKWISSNCDGFNGFVGTHFLQTVDIDASESHD